MSYMNQTRVEEIVASAANKGSKKRVYGTDEIPHLWAHMDAANVDVTEMGETV